MQPDDYLPHMMRDKSAGRQVTACVVKSAWTSLHVATDTDKSLVLNAIERCTQYDLTVIASCCVRKNNKTETLIKHRPFLKWAGGNFV